MFLETRARRYVDLATLPSSMSRLCRQCGILNILQTYRSLRPVTGIALFFTLGILELQKQRISLTLRSGVPHSQLSRAENRFLQDFSSQRPEPAG
jgi:hypothetical protein